MLDFSDQTKIFDPETWSWPVHLIGAGGINNLVGIVLAKMGVREIHVWDNDMLESHNLPTEVGYSARMRGAPKVQAMADAIHYAVDDYTKVTQHQTYVDKCTPLSGVVIVGVDSMSSRAAIWETVVRQYLEIPFFIDGRSGGEETQIFAFSPADFEAREIYESWLFDDKEAAQLECGARNIGYISAYMAAEIGHLITLYHRGIKNDPVIMRNFAKP